MVRKKDVRPGMRVRNTVSGRIVTVRSDPEKPSRFYVASFDRLAVSYVRENGGKSSYHYRWWCLENLEIVTN